MSDTLTNLLPLARGAACHSEQAPQSRRRSSRAASWCVAVIFWIAALASIGLAAANFRRLALAADRVEELCRLSAANQVGRGSCAVFARTQPPVMFDPDSECWIDLTQKQYREGSIRPHDDPFDNTPYGRERHWSSSFSWWLLLLAGLAHALGGLPMEPAIAEVAPWANPVLFACFLTALALVLRRRIGAWATGAFILTLTTLPGVEWDFSSGHPDHHGLHLMAFTGLFLGALLGGMGWVRGAEPDDDDDSPSTLGLVSRWLCPTEARAREWFTASGVCGGIGLWIGSTQQIVCIGVLGAGAALAALCFAPRRAGIEPTRFVPELWRHWSRVGAVTSLVFYAIEYFPHHLEMHLEVNHPLIALGWAGAGEVMWAITRAKVDGTRDRWRTLLAHALLGLLGLAAMPLAILCGPPQWFVLRDPILVWSVRIMSEAQPWLDLRHPAAALGKVWNDTGVLLLAVPLAIAGLIWRRQDPWRRGALLALLLSTGVFLGWTLLQTRWLGFLEISLLLLTFATVACLPAGDRGRLRWWLLLGFLLPGWLGFSVLQVRTLNENAERHAASLLENMMALKEAAWNLELYSHGGGRPARVMAPPGDSPTFHYYGGVETVGSYYWENFAGAHVAVDFYNDAGDYAEARRIVRERGLDFVVALAQPSFVLEMQMLKTGRVNVVAARHTLAFRLSSPSPAGVPPWLERLPLLDAPVADAVGFRIYRVRRDRM